MFGRVIYGLFVFFWLCLGCIEVIGKVIGKLGKWCNDNANPLQWAPVVILVEIDQ